MGKGRVNGKVVYIPSNSVKIVNLEDWGKDIEDMQETELPDGSIKQVIVKDRWAFEREPVISKISKSKAINMLVSSAVGEDKETGIVLDDDAHALVFYSDYSIWDSNGDGDRKKFQKAKIVGINYSDGDQAYVWGKEWNGKRGWESLQLAEQDEFQGQQLSDSILQYREKSRQKIREKKTIIRKRDNSGRMRIVSSNSKVLQQTPIEENYDKKKR